MVLNELVHNALEHAFVGRNDGLIDVEAKKVNNDVVLKVKDNGIGFREKDMEGSKNLGIKIIKTLVEEDLKGTIRFTIDKGTTVEARFPFFMAEEVCNEDNDSG